MNYEKTCYSLIGCLVAGTAIQKDMDLPWQYLIVIALGLWGICIGVQWWMYKREQELKRQLDLQGQKLRSDELERLIITIVGNTDKQIQCLKDEMDLLKERQTAGQKQYMETIRSISVTLEKMQEDVICYNEKECGYLETSSSLLADNLKCCEKLVSSIADAEKENEISRKELFDNLIAAVKDNNESKLITTIQGTLESLSNKATELAQIENRVYKVIETIPQILSDNHGILLQTNAANVDTLKCLGILTDAVNSSGKTASENIEKKAQLLYKSVKDADTNLGKLLQSIQNSIGDTNKSIESVSDDFQGLISNVQQGIDIANQSLSDIGHAGKQNNDTLEDIKNKISEMEDSIAESADSISESINDNMNRQGEIVSNEEEILGKYDTLLSRINDEIVVKMVSDSDNLLKCMKDCYNLLDSLRRTKR